MKTRTNKITAILLSILTIVSIFTIIPVDTVNAATTKHTITKGAQDSSGRTYKYWIDKNSNKKLGFCVDPKKFSPSNGQYSFTNIADIGFNVNQIREISQVLYYGYNGPAYSVAKNAIEKKLKERSKTAKYPNFSSDYTVHNATHEALAYLYHNKKTSYGNSPDAGQALLEVVNKYPKAPLASVYRATTGEYTQDILYGEFKIHFFISKNSTDNTLRTSMKGITYKIYESSDPIATIELDKKYGEGTKNFEGTQAGVYVKDNSFSGYLNSINNKILAYGKTAGSLYTLKNSISFKAKEDKTNPAFQKDIKEYKMVYYKDASDGHAIFAPEGDWPSDQQYIRLQMLKVSANPNAPSPLTGAVYAVSNDPDCDFKGVPDNRKITIGADGYGALGTSTSTNKSVNEGEDEKYANKPSGGAIPHSKNVRWYCREIVAPKGYDIDSTVYEFKRDDKTDGTVQTDKAGVPIFRPIKYEGKQKIRLESTDMPLVKLQLAKTSDYPEITEDNSCYSYKDAEFDIFWKEDNTGTVSPGCDYTEYTGNGTSGYVIKTDAKGYGRITQDRDGNTIASSGVNRNDQKESVFYGKRSGPNIPLLQGRTYYCKERVAPKNFVARDAYYEFKDTGLTDSNGIPIFRASNATMVDAKTVFSKEGLWNKESATNITANRDAITNLVAGDPFPLEIKKVDPSQTGEGKGRSMSNAIFKVSYYDIEASEKHEKQVQQMAIVGENGEIIHRPELLQDIENSKKAPQKTWYIKTTYDANTNKYFAELDDRHLTSFGVEQSSALFKDDLGRVFLPVGIVSIEEVKAPRGYKKTSNIYLYNLKYSDFAFPTIKNKPLIEVEELVSSTYVGVVKVNTSDQRISGAVYYLYDDHDKAADEDGFKNIENCIAKVTTTEDPNGDVFKNKDNENTPYVCESGKQYFFREVLAPEGYELDPTIYEVTPNNNNNTTSKMAKKTSVEGNVPYGKLKISKTSNETLPLPWTLLTGDVYTSEDDGTGNKVFLKDNTNLKNICFAVWKYDGDKYNQALDPMPTSKKTPSYAPIEIGTTDDSGSISWDRLMVYENGSTTEKQHYLVKELGYEVFFPDGVNTVVFQDGIFRWAINKSDCINIGDRYFEGLVNQVFTTNFQDVTGNVFSNKLYPKYYYGNPDEAEENARGRVITISENGTTEFAKPFHNTVPTTELEIDKTMYAGNGQNTLFELRSEYGNIMWSDNGPSYNFCIRGNQKITGLPACVPKADTSICIPMKYHIVEKGVVVRGAITKIDGILQEPKIENNDLYVPVEAESDSRKVTFKVKNRPNVYTVSLHKDAFDESSDSNNVKDIWFEIVGVITNLTMSDSKDAYSQETTMASLPKFLSQSIEEIRSDLAAYYEKQSTGEHPENDPFIQYEEGFTGRGDNVYECDENGNVKRVLPILGYDKNGNPITRITIKTDDNGNAQSHFFEDGNIVDNSDYVHLWSLVDNEDSQGTSTWVDRTAQDNVGSILYGQENTLLPEGERLDAREKLEGFVTHPMDGQIETCINYAIGIRVSELGKLTDPNDPNSFVIDDRYVVPEPQYGIYGVEKGLIYTFENRAIVKDLELIKKNDNGKELSGSIWLMYDKNTNLPIRVTYDPEEEKYVFDSIGNADELIDSETGVISAHYALETDSNGLLYIKDIPYGEYYMKEESPPIGYLPYGEPIYFEVTEDEEDGGIIKKTYTVVDGANIMPNTGGTKTVLPIVVTSIAIPAAIFTTFYLFKKRKRKIR